MQGTRTFRIDDLANFCNYLIYVFVDTWGLYHDTPNWKLYEMLFRLTQSSVASQMSGFYLRVHQYYNEHGACFYTYHLTYSGKEIKPLVSLR